MQPQKGETKRFLEESNVVVYHCRKCKDSAMACGGCEDAECVAQVRVIVPFLNAHQGHDVWMARVPWLEAEKLVLPVGKFRRRRGEGEDAVRLNHRGFDRIATKLA